jgi:hypothetical protein
MLGALKTETLLETNHINAVVSLTDAGLAAWATMREYVPRDRHLILFVRILQHRTSLSTWATFVNLSTTCCIPSLLEPS